MTGREKIPKSGAAVLVANHVSYVDALIIMGASTRPIRFVMDKTISEMPLLKYLFRHAGVIPICSPKQDEATYLQAFELIHSALADGELVCIFPEGQLTPNGELGEFKSGIDSILSRDPVLVVPMALHGLWGSYFSHKDGHALAKWPRRFWSRVTVTITDAMAAELANKTSLHNKVAQLLKES